MALDFTELDDFVAESPGAPLKGALMTEIKTNIEAAALGGSVTGSSTFNGTAGRVITIEAQADTGYFVSITPSAAPSGNLGSIWVVANSTTQFTVYNEGTATIAFNWRVMP